MILGSEAERSFTERRSESIAGISNRGVTKGAPNPPEFAQPRLSRVKRRSSPTRGCKFGCVCSYMAGITQV